MRFEFRRAGRTGSWKLLPLLLAALSIPACAQPPTQLPKTVSPPDACWALKRHGKMAEANTCFSRLAGQKDPYFDAEGKWGLGDLQPASDRFRDAVAAKPKDPKLRVRWGLMFLERQKKKEAADLFGEALEIQKDY